LLKFCGLDWEQSVIEFTGNQRTIVTCSSIQARQKIYSSSIAKWEKYKEELAPFKRFFEENGVL